VSTPVSPHPQGSGRLAWLDANRFLAALGVVLIHSTTDFGGQPFAASPPAERIGPALIRSVAELSGAEMFLVFSLFLIAFKLERRNLGYGATVGDQAKRLLIPFVVWTVFYAFFRLFKADTFGYGDAIMTEISQWPSWVGYLLLGSAQYHLHFLPTLFFIVLLYPAMLAAVRYPVAGLAIIPLIYVMDFVQGWLWGHVSDPMWRDYLVRAVKIVCYLGYGLAAAACYGVWRRGVSRADAWHLFALFLFLTSIAFMATLIYAAQIIDTGQWGIRPGAASYGHLLMPVLVFTVFMTAQYASWSSRFSWLARFTFGIYLVHPIFIDLYDIALYRSGWSLSPTAMVLTKYVLATAAAFAFALLLSKIRSLAWLIGLGPVPLLPQKLTTAEAAKHA